MSVMPTSPIAAAFTQQIVQSMDPMQGVMRTMVAGTVDKQKLDLAIERATAIESIEVLLSSAVERKASPMVIAAYERLLKAVTGK